MMTMRQRTMSHIREHLRKEVMTSITTPGKRITSLGVLALSALVVLTGCGDTGKAATNSTNDTSNATASSVERIYQFDDVKAAEGRALPVSVPAPAELTVQLSDELASIAAPVDFNVKSFTLKGRAFPTGDCALDIQVEYTDGGAAIASRDIQVGDEQEQTDSEMVFDRLGNQHYDLKMVDVIPSDDDIEQGTNYLTNDYSAMTIVDECSEDMDEKFANVRFPYVAESKTGDGGTRKTIENFAAIRVSVFGDGAIGYLGGVGGAKVESDGKVNNPTTKWVPYL